MIVEYADSPATVFPSCCLTCAVKGDREPTIPIDQYTLPLDTIERVKAELVLAPTAQRSQNHLRQARAVERLRRNYSRARLHLPRRAAR